MKYNPISPLPVDNIRLIGVYEWRGRVYVLARDENDLLISFKRIWNKSLPKFQDIRWIPTGPEEHVEVLSIAAQCKLKLNRRTPDE